MSDGEADLGGENQGGLMDQVMKAKYVQRMRVLAAESRGDQEKAHEKADELIIEILKNVGLAEIAEQYEEVYKWFA